ncbi:hypothetical protein CVT24_007478 [Panaeolus cyanescens]|uniref:Uncharacterized protein n=1 Tax=Panaeolus cyanescens TaxID=181874 RepID=A0A409YL94_9AGAR|nr:hypothetical protein CVT24_007478 [Panaeolus cyanescens]
MRYPSTSLGDFPIDEEDIRLSVTSNALVALNTLNPPSPVLTPSQLSFTWSSGEIPVLLYDNAYLKHDGVRRSISSVNSESLMLERISTSMDLSTVEEDVLPSREWRIGTPRVFSTDAAAVPPSSLASFDSHATLTSVGTFGPRRDTATSGGWRRTAVIPTDSIYLSTLISDATLLSAGTESKTDSNCPSLPDTCLSQKRPLSAFLEQITDNLDKLECSSVSNSGDNQSDASVDPNETVVGSPTPSTLSWISSRDWTWQEYKDYVAQDASVCYERARPDSQLMSSADVMWSASDQTRRVALQQQDLNTSRSKRTSTKEDVNRASLQLKSKIHTVLYTGQDQDRYPWLKDTTVQIMIDQEGFRAAEPLFKFASIGKLRTTHDTAKPSSTIMAQFRPSTRQTFHFHHAPFETPPILRRVIINADEGHDFVSRQAHLTLKNNGVYVVHGHEVSSDPESAGQKLFWQFEYFVDDRRAEPSGRILEGEKVLIPLTFACSPKLLLSVQGKRVNIVQVFKKGIAPKIVAEKLQPPGTMATRPASTAEHSSFGSKSASSTTTPTKTHRISSPTKSPIWTLHRRVQSHNIRQPDASRSFSPNATPQPPARNAGFSPLPWVSPVFKSQYSSPSRRRAASVSESTPDLLSRPQAMTPSPKNHRVFIENSTPSSSLAQKPNDRHIIPPYKLNEYVDTNESQADYVPSRKTATFQPHHDFTPLTPRPRHSQKATDRVRRSLE